MRLLNIIRTHKKTTMQGIFEYLKPMETLHKKEETQFDHIELEKMKMVYKTDMKTMTLRVTNEQERQLSVVGLRLADYARSKMEVELDTQNEIKIYEMMRELGSKNPSIKPIRFAWLKNLITKWFGYRFLPKFNDINTLGAFIHRSAGEGYKYNYKGSYNFIVVNSRVASALQEHPAFVHAPLEQKTFAGEIEKIGVLSNRITVYANRYLPFSDETIVYGFSGTEVDAGVHYFFVNREVIETQSPEHMAKTYSLIEHSQILATPESNTIYYTQQIQLAKGLI
jgi:hypothetical protein